MFIYYETSVVNSTEVGKFVLSSYGQLPIINWKADKTEAEFILQFFKRIDRGSRSYDTDKKIWIIIGTKPIHTLLSVLNSLVPAKMLPNLLIIKINNLEARIAAGDLRRAPDVSFGGQRIFNTENFYYSQVPEVSKVPKDNEKLASLLGIQENELTSLPKAELKKFYRKAALRFHPDRNQGDESKMSELNVLWGAFNA
jgi:hypothetical protein